jgi:uridine kinase
LTWPVRITSRQRIDLLTTLARSATAIASDRVVRVGVDGVDGAGKTVFADELAEAVRALGRPAVRASVDGFHQPRAGRYRLGKASPEGYFADSYDYPLLREVLLDPLSPGGDGRYRAAAFDHRSDQTVDSPWEQAAGDAVLVFDGIFLHRQELRGYWDFSVFLDVSTEESVARCAVRDGADPDLSHPSNRRYVKGQRLYLTQCRPASHASVVVDNQELSSPRLVSAPWLSTGTSSASS